MMESVHVSSPSFQTNPTRENCVIVLLTPSTVRLPVVAVRYGRVHDTCYLHDCHVTHLYFNWLNDCHSASILFHMNKKLHIRTLTVSLFTT